MEIISFKKKGARVFVSDARLSRYFSFPTQTMRFLKKEKREEENLNETTCFKTISLFSLSLRSKTLTISVAALPLPVAPPSAEELRSSPLPRWKYPAVKLGTNKSAHSPTPCPCHRINKGRRAEQWQRHQGARGGQIHRRQALLVIFK